VVAYRLFENPIFIEANRELSILDEGAAEESGMHRAKSGAGHSQYGPAFNRVYTTYTRTQDSLIIFEIDTRDISALLAVLRTIAQKAVPLAETPPETTEADWVEAIKKVFKSGNVNLAQLLFDKHVQSALDFYDFVQEFYAPNPKVEVKQSEQEVVVEAAGGGGFPREEVSEKPTKQPIHQSKVKKTTASKGVSISPKRKTCAQYVVAISEHFNSDDLLANLREALAHFSLSDLLSASFKHATAKKAKSGSIKLIDFIKEDLDRITLFFSCLEKKEIVKKVDVLALRKQLKLDVMNKKKEAETKKILTLKLRSFEEVQRVDLFLKGDTMPLKEQFFIAAERNDEAMLEASLIGNTFDMNTLSPNGATALLLAAQNGHEGIVRRLLACDGVDVNKEMEGILITPLYVATQNRHVNIVEALLQHKDIKVDKVNSQGATALYIAAQNGYEELVELLLSHHAQINWAGVQGVTPLLIAVTNGRERVVRLLCSNEAIDMNASDQNKSTPLYIAVQTGNLAFVRFFLAHKKIQVNQFKDQGVKILDMALLYGYVDIARLLFAHKDIPHQRFKDQDIHFLCRAAENGQVDVLRLLFSEYKDIDINACNRKGLTALCCAVRGGHEAVVEMLLSVKGIDVYARDEHFQTACDKAREAGHGGIEMKLLEAERAFRSCSAFDIPASPSGFFSQSTAAAADEPLHCVDYDSGSSDNGLFKS
jgi:ankyrin repeat protein